jgi:hypothetical protein
MIQQVGLLLINVVMVFWLKGNLNDSDTKIGLTVLKAGMCTTNLLLLLQVYKSLE